MTALVSRQLPGNRWPHLLVPNGKECSTLDFRGQGIQTIEVLPHVDPLSIIYDRNAISSLAPLLHYVNLQQLSASENKIKDLSDFPCLRHLTVLNLANNAISHIQGLDSLYQLSWLNLSENEIKVIDGLKNHSALEHLDLSDNAISSLGNLSHLLHLKILLLHGNCISSLRSSSAHLPASLVILSLAQNNIGDLNEVSYLACLPNLQQLSVMNNPSVIMTASHTGFDYRPFVVNWCYSLQVLDGYVVTEKESLKAEWLFSQGKGRLFRPGQHLQLVQYLASTCPLTTSRELERAEDVRLSRILRHQRVHQQHLQEGQSSSSRPQRQLPDNPSAKSPSPRPVVSLCELRE
ncbi:hypothetical protein CAPTEDRAFT_208434 [Capitella teleta]|uniref:Centrosomal protein of 97 kDa n=1 Tax=Capitella teleta TaxID=283909 RepID=R7TU27_CAPTE|nr:hypothetical protein CAPTEDRAFT_208434 [Capitella teleta]|eukprot:ELT97107.1 hypothetical protein CAPTEDRAFT_208434 [Capitella teleta]